MATPVYRVLVGNSSIIVAAMHPEGRLLHDAKMSPPTNARKNVPPVKSKNTGYEKSAKPRAPAKNIGFRPTRSEITAVTGVKNSSTKRAMVLASNASSSESAGRLMWASQVGSQTNGK